MNIAAERKVIKNYSERMSSRRKDFGDPGLVIRLEDILAEETDHAEEMERLQR